MSSAQIHDVSDTAIWVAHYRAKESQRPDALFQDPLAIKLSAQRGKQIAQYAGSAQQVEWSVVIRTKIIDAFIENLIANGVDTIVNLGAGLDCRPYRLELPSSLRWFEVDYPHMIQFKEQELAKESSRAQLQRIGLDLADQGKRQQLFADIAKNSGKILVLTEGVIPYLNVEHVRSLSADLQDKLRCQYWILDYFNPTLMRYIRYGSLRRKLKNAPFQFLPGDWFQFFEKAGWNLDEMRYLSDVSKDLGRDLPMNWANRLLSKVLPPATLNIWKRSSGYAILKPSYFPNQPVS